jgi:hypothetical protein
MSGRRLAGALVAAVTATPGVAFAFDVPGDTQALPCRPTIACTADLVAPGSLEIEAGILYRSLAGGVKQLSNPLFAKLTVARWLQLQVGSSGYTSERGATSVEYFDNINVGAKFHLVDQTKWVPSMSASLTASVPSGAQAGYTEYDDLFLTGYVTKDLGPVHADFNAGYNRYALNVFPVPQGWVALSLSTSLPKGFGVAVENYYFSPAGIVAGRDAGGLVALTYNPVPWLVFDVGADVGYVTATRDFSVFGGVTFVPFRLWNPENAAH